MFKLRNLVLVVLVIGMATPVLAQTLPATMSAETYTVSLGKTKDFGQVLVGKDGLTLYIFTVDPLNDSKCTDKCATAWPPLTVASADKLTADEDIPGKLGTFKRADGTLQVTYNGMALYYWFKDKAAGDTTGNRVTRNWWVVPAATAYAQELPKVGNVLVGANGMTLYTFSKDTAADTSTCADQCAQNWPPLTVKSADEFVPGINLPGKFNTFKRADGTLQVSYNGKPLYYFKNDKAIGDAAGEGVGGVWSTVVPETVAVSANKDLGNILVTADGMTLYTYAKDSANTSTCTDQQCSKNWPPFWVYTNDRLAVGAGISGKLGTIKLNDTENQVTYNGMPLYVYAKDSAPGDATGQNVGNVWAVVKQ